MMVHCLSMHKESGFPTEAERSAFDHYETIPFTAEEQADLHQQAEGTFEPHPTFKGVEVKSIDVKNVPISIQERILAIGGDITSFSAIRIQHEIPLHKHTIDGEVYFGGTDGTITLLDASRNEIGQFSLSDHSFTLTTIGEWHGVTSTNEKGSAFFGVKFNQRSGE
jgi:hypothetical protein